MDICYCLYQLSKSTHSSRTGALLKIEFEKGLVGFTDCHPWEELGDAPLTEQLNLLKEERLTSLTKRSLHFARLDAHARMNGINLFTGLTIPTSHFLIPNLMEWDQKAITTALQQGFTRFKVKLGRNLSQELLQLERLCPLIGNSKLRLDFNLKLLRDQFKLLEPWNKYIDFYEDPFPYDNAYWSSLQQSNNTMALDHNSEAAIGAIDSTKVLVIKSAVQDETPFLTHAHPKQRLVFTSYLDHPLGQLTAAFTAAKALQKLPEQVDICGLLSHKVYQPNVFSEQLTNGPLFIPPPGTGFGFDELLAEQLWRVL